MKKRPVSSISQSGKISTNNELQVRNKNIWRKKIHRECKDMMESCRVHVDKNQKISTNITCGVRLEPLYKRVESLIE